MALAGVVRGPDGEPVPQARVFIAGGPVPVPDIAALTDAEGRFALSLPAAGAYQLECVADGFAPLSTTVEVGGGREAQVELRLIPDRPAP
jgi:Carboxypeptidase regulatory-like domain